MPIRHHRRAWVVALTGTLLLHGAALWLMQRPPGHVFIEGPAQTWRVQLYRRTAAEPPTPLPQAAPTADEAPPRSEPAPSPPQPIAPAPVRPDPPATPSPAPTPSADTPSLWLEANQADRAPAPVDNRWRLADLPWPAAFPVVEVVLWIASDGRIERFELQGDAANDPTLRRLFAPLADTPMHPAYIGRARVPSTMRVQMRPGEDGGAPDFVAPLPPLPR